MVARQCREMQSNLSRLQVPVRAVIIETGLLRKLSALSLSVEIQIKPFKWLLTRPKIKGKEQLVIPESGHCRLRERSFTREI